MTTKHTAGPWGTEKRPQSYGGIIHQIYRRAPTDGGSYFTKVIARLETDDEETQANARLIAAAPEMLATLRLIANRMEHTNINTPIKDMRDIAFFAREAIAKAEGGE